MNSFPGVWYLHLCLPLCSTLSGVLQYGLMALVFPKFNCKVIVTSWWWLQLYQLLLKISAIIRLLVWNTYNTHHWQKHSIFGGKSWGWRGVQQDKHGAWMPTMKWTRKMALADKAWQEWGSIPQPLDYWSDTLTVELFWHNCPTTYQVHCNIQMYKHSPVTPSYMFCHLHRHTGKAGDISWTWWEVLLADLFQPLSCFQKYFCLRLGYPRPELVMPWVERAIHNEKHYFVDHIDV